ncbi:MAG: FprA family A-type flavoprotein [Methanobrevibacter sp.]|uniref:FprA family A-type flavoprotein n=1 Tax=Methanobrevibacter sp. TaxID=66852 RepID=UPI0025FD1EE6|nr:FprA family A-type flavoprotein [Methanobrevibacter sp.]MBQ8017859.1 FprA family A-type flavoprotein [Methanobrevibacter sp.]
MKAESVKIADGVYWVGALHWNTRSFHGFAIPGTTYNCYLVFGEEKVALIDNVFSDGMINQLNARIKDAFAKENREEKIDVFIQCHTELDHSIGLKETIDRYPEAEVYASPKGAEFLQKQYHTYSDVEITTVKTGDEIDLGGKTLAVVSAPMLHWPDSMFVMLKESGILFSNDAFGQHLCLSKRYAEDYSEDYIMTAAKKFFANLVVLGSPMLRMKFQELTDAGIVEQITMIAPCHGQIWKDPSKIIQAYSDWASGVCEDKITIVYDTMHHSTEKLAFQIAEGIMSEGVEAVMYHMENDYESEVVTDILDSKAIALGAPTMMNKPFPRIGNIMYWLDCLNFKGTTSEKNALIFSSKGWGGGAVKKLQDDLESAGFTIFDTLDAVFVPDEDVYGEAYQKGVELAKSIKGE